MLDYFPDNLQSATLEYYSGYKEKDIIACVRDLNEIKLAQETSKYTATTRKFSSDKLLAVAKIPPIRL